MNNKNESKIWIYVGKLGVLVAIIWGIIQIINFIVKSPEYSAEIQCRHNSYETSPWHFETIHSILEYKAVLYLLNKKGGILNNLDIDSLIDSYKDKRNIKDKHEYDLILSQMSDDVSRDYNEMWIFNIKNNGNKSLEDLVLEFPYKGYYKLSISSKIMKSTYFEKKIEVGDIRPSNETEIYCWTNHEKPITENEESNIKFTHKNGVCEVSYPIEVSGIYAWFNKNNGYSIFFVILITLLLNMFYFLGKRTFWRK